MPAPWRYHVILCSQDVVAWSNLHMPSRYPGSVQPLTQSHTHTVVSSSLPDWGPIGLTEDIFSSSSWLGIITTKEDKHVYIQAQEAPWLNQRTAETMLCHGHGYFFLEYFALPLPHLPCPSSGSCSICKPSDLFSSPLQWEEGLVLP